MILHLPKTATWEHHTHKRKSILQIWRAVHATGTLKRTSTSGNTTEKQCLSLIIHADIINGADFIFDETQDAVHASTRD